MKNSNQFFQINSILFFTILLLQSCGSLSSLQTAKVIGKGEATIGAAAFAYGLTENASGSGGDLTGVSAFPHLEAAGRYGLSNSVDLGLKISSSGNFQLDGKVQFAGNLESKFAAAIGGGFEYQISDVSENFVYRAHLPLYISYHPTAKDGIYAVPRFIYQSVSDGDNSNFIGGGMGYARRFSEHWTGILEGNLFGVQTDNSNSDELLYQIGVAGIYHF